MSALDELIEWATQEAPGNHPDKAAIVELARLTAIESAAREYLRLRRLPHDPLAVAEAWMNLIDKLEAET